MKLKIDLHTHLWEATNYVSPNVDVVSRILNKVKERGLDGIGITEHSDIHYAHLFIEVVKKHFPQETLTLIPGQEVNSGWLHIVELHLPGNYLFRFLAHPDTRWESVDDIQGIEIENGMHVGQIDQQKVKAIAEERDLLLMHDSDAHYVNDIGCFYNEIELEELYRRAKKISPKF
ncbi:MAG: PHP domain-containing protein [Dehalococcoidia bacterium]|nr:PHP domain-containing protein [Dehalococcoidia bacterium]